MIWHNTKFFICGVLAVMMAMVIFGCSSSIPKDSALAKNWGRSFETQQYLQVANPDAGLEDEMTGSPMMDGPVADAAAEQYRKSFGEEAVKETVGIIPLKGSN